MFKRIIIAAFLSMSLSGCWLMAGAAGGYVVGRELEEEEQQKDPAGANQPEVYK